MIISIIIGAVITLSIWLCRDLLAGTVPLFVFNLAGILGIPGTIGTLLIVGIFSSQKSWQAIHGVTPYSYFAYGGNFLFYFFVSCLIQILIHKFKKGT